MIKKTHQGFTLIELIIVISIIIISSSLLLVSYKDDSQKNALIISGQKIISDIKIAQNSSFTSKKFGTSLPDGWGIYFTKINNKYFIFADTNNDKVYNSGEETKESSLLENIEINDIIINSISYNEGSVFFEIDNGNIFVNNSQPNEEAVIIEIKNKKNDSGQIKINNVGAISFSIE